MPSTHAKFGPSSLRYREICAGWQHSPGTSAAADEGTMMHEAAETGDLSALTPEQRAQVQECLEYVLQFEEGADEVHKELKLDCAGLTWGTADRVIIRGSGDHGHIIDFKFGRWPVDDADANLQGWAYAVGVFHMFPVDRVTVHFLIPRIDTATRHTFIRATDYDRMKTRIAAVIARAELPEPPLNADPKACQYCAAKATCPALTQKALMIPANQHWDLPADIDPAAITEPEQLAKVLHVVPVLEAWASEIKRVALDMARNGANIPGYTLRSRSGKRTIKDLLPAWAILNEEFGIQLEDFLPACSVSIGALEDAVKSKAEKGGGAKKLRQLNSRFAEAGIVSTAAEIDYLSKDKT